MSSTNINTTVKILESLPEPIQDRVLEHLREYIEELRDEMKWDQSFRKTRNQLSRIAKEAKKEIKAGRAKPLDISQL